MEIVKDSCLDNLDKCKAECCWTFIVPMERKPRPLELITIHKKEITESQRWYFELHNCRVNENTIQFRARPISFRDKKMLQYSRCKLLDDNCKCRGYPDDRPQECKDLTRKTRHETRFYIPKKCMFNDE